MYRNNMETTPAKVGETVSVTGDMRLCGNGLHASLKLRDAADCYRGVRCLNKYYSRRYNGRNMLCRVRCMGGITNRRFNGTRCDDKFISRHRTPLYMVRCTDQQVLRIAEGKLTVKNRKLVKA